MRPVEFTLVQAEKSDVKVTVDADRVETVVDGTVMNNPGVTQVAMASGRTFFVVASYKETILKLYGAYLGTA